MQKREEAQRRRGAMGRGSWEWGEVLGGERRGNEMQNTGDPLWEEEAMRTG